MKKLLLICIGFIALTPTASFAVEEKFFEYATDVGSPVEVPSGSSAIQEFKIYNDYINAVDVWFDNTGSSGSATFSLLSSANALLASRTVTVGHADPFYTGQRLHVNFNKTVGANSGSTYRLKIVSATPQLRLYAIKRVQFVEHNAPYPVDSAVGASFLNDEEQFAAFKFALYEESDVEAPVITNASTTLWGSDAVKVSFNANELVDYSLSYGPVGGVSTSIGYSGNYSICFEGVRACSITIDTQRATVYNYRLNVRDSQGNESHVDGAFESWNSGTPVPPAPSPTEPPAAPPPSTPTPAPLAIANARIVSATDRSTKVSWDTDRAANGVLTVSTDPVASDVVATVRDDTREIVHTLEATGLAANTAYYATIVSRDANGVTAAQTIAFSTLRRSAAAPAGVQPQASAPLNASVSDEQRSLSLAWGIPAAGEPGVGYRIDIIDGNGALFRSVTVPSGTHSATVDGLTGGAYSAIVYGDNNGVIEKTTEPAIVYVRAQRPPLDTYELIKKPIVYIPSILFVILVAGLYWYSRRRKNIISKQ